MLAIQDIYFTLDQPVSPQIMANFGDFNRRGSRGRSGIAPESRSSTRTEKLSEKGGRNGAFYAPRPARESM